MAEFRVSSEAVEAASADVAEHLVEFEGRVAACQSLVSGLIGADWAGGAADAFASDWTEWLQGAATVQDALAGISRLLAESASTYADTETHVASASASSEVTTTPAATPSGRIGTPGQAR
ncbi:WXG100 family type VII secretion target [Frondihabitans sp. Leaf304]|uniref:WXG100 family type VII secretion target n=1 Tax=Frondihabitans sp. Leaf304 TaxID=1736329 RepID=UPI0006F52A40|nr:WXG100 family type VII secretion target [Frondihabitans sp. Leaf304]KQQ26840.1 hypothetical protein ASF54_12905 [Frondihabitans sp. Leaf304]